MSESQSWGRLKEILSQAMKLLPAERAAYLDEACADDTKLRAELDELLAAHDEAGSFLSDSEMTKLADASVVTEQPGDKVGKYKLLQPLGEGGFGMVYMAQQDEPVRRRVALKVIKLGMDTRQVVARFEAERQALALMDHPGIAKVYDAGATEAGRPFFVMELVKGVPITEYCDSRRLSLEERLELFVQVCQAVQHAHQKGIVHRDIKPSNVLVTHVDDTPAVKVIDFGIAKAMDHQLSEATVFTMVGQLVGTPLYMSPEQADPIGLDVDTRSDVYSLGVLLYELVTGTTPFTVEDIRGAAFDEVRRIIREEDPPTASSRVSSLGERLADTASARQSDARRLPERIRGDLDAILMMALEKDRTRRYAGALDFARDIEAYLGDDPVQARFPTPGYRLQKFVRRNRGPVIAGAMILAALVFGIIGTTIFAIRASQAEQEARAEADTNERITEFLVGLFDSTKPAEMRDNELTAREILQDGAARLDFELRDSPLIRARLQTIIGRVFVDLGHHDDAEGQLQSALERFETGELQSTEHQLDALWTLTDLHVVRGDFETALEYVQRGEEVLTAWAEAPSHAEAFPLFHRGRIASGQFNFETALAAYTQAREILVAHGEGDSQTATSCLLNSANQHFMMGELARADTLYQEIIDIYERTLAPGHYYLATPLHNRALIAVSHNRLEEARALEERSLEVRTRVLDQHWHTALSLSTLGYINKVEGDLEKAREMYEQAIEINDAHYDPIKYETGFDLDMLGRVLVELGELDEAEPLLQRASHIFTELGTYRSGYYGWLLLARGQAEAAETYFRETLEQDGDVWFGGIAMDCHLGLAEIARLRGDFDLEFAEVKRAVEQGNSTGMDQPGLVKARETLAEMEVARERR